MNFPMVDINKPVLGFVTQHCCIRVIKQAYCLRRLGYKVRLFTHRVPSQEQLFFSDVNVHKTRERLRELVVESPDVDIWHVHNEPTSLVLDVVNSTKKPVVFDVHDANAGRFGDDIDPDDRAEEQEAFDRCSAVVHVGEQYGEYVNEFYGVDKPFTVVYSKIPKDWYQIPKNGNGCVYQGGAHTPYQLRSRPFGNRDFSVLANNFMKAGIDLYWYSVNKEAGKWLELGWGVKYMGGQSFFELLSTLTRYGWGIALFMSDNGNAVQTSGGMPNKTFDYMAAGIPVIGTKGTHFGDYIEEHGIGIALDYYDVPEIPDPAPYKERVLEMRDSLSMDEEIKKVEALYGELF